MIERQELHCHACQRYVQFDLDTNLDGNHVLECPNCGHEHCRVVKDGVITGDRWDQRNAHQTYVVSANTMTTSSNSITIIYSGTTAGPYLSQAWSNSTAIT